MGHEHLQPVRLAEKTCSPESHSHQQILHKQVIESYDDASRKTVFSACNLWVKKYQITKNVFSPSLLYCTEQRCTVGTAHGYTVLFRGVLYCTILFRVYCTIQGCTLLFRGVLYYSGVYCTVLFRGVLYRQGEGALDTIDLEDALLSFLDWLHSLGGEECALRNLNLFNPFPFRPPFPHVPNIFEGSSSPQLPRALG